MATSEAKRTKKRVTEQTILEQEYGKEPDFSFSMPIESKRNLNIAVALKWYTNVYDKKKSESFVIDWLKNQTYRKLSKDILKSVSQNFGSYFSPTFFGLMKMESRGWVLSEKETNQIFDHINMVAGVSKQPEVTSSTQTDTKTTTVERKSPQELLRTKINGSVLAELEGTLDDWLFAGRGVTKEPYDLSAKIIEHEIKGTVAINLIKDWMNEKIAEYTEVLSKKDPEIVEAYTLKPVNLKWTLAQLKTMLDSLDLIKVNVQNQQKQKRKPRTKKVVPTQKIVENVKYKAQDTTFGITSILPESVLGKTVLYLFDTKYKSLRVLYSESVFSVKGTTVQGVDEALSFSIKLRKPEEVLPLVLTKTKLQIKKLLNGLSTKPAKTSGRINENVVILRAL